MKVRFNMKLDKKGMTLVEIIVSLALISLVLIFLMSLFIKVRGTYNQSKIQADYEILVANIVKAVGDDIENYGLYSVEWEDKLKHEALIITFDEFRPSKLSERIKKVLRVYFRENKYYVSYSYESIGSYNSTAASRTADITSDERITSNIRPIPEDVVIDSNNYINLEKENWPDGSAIIKINIPLSNAKGNIYDINIFGTIRK